MRFKIDENLPTEAAGLLTAVGHDALTIHDQQMVGQPDPQVASICRTEQRVLVTLDLDFSDIRTYPPGSRSGVLVIRLGHQSPRMIRRAVHRIGASVDLDDLAGCIGVWRDGELRVRRP